MAIHIYTPKEIEDVIVKTNNFINEHLLNYNKAIKRIICKGLIKKETIDDYRTFKNCSFDEYIKFLIQLEPRLDYTELIEVHASFHKLVSEMLSRYLTNQAISEQLFNNLYFVHTTLINLLKNIIDRFDFAKNQMDNLTGTWNKDIFMRFIEKEYHEIKNENKTFSLVHFDIDNFVEINEKYSHDTGDYILTELIKVFKNYLRDYDSISRWGGVKFLILLPDTAKEQCLEIMNKIDDTLKQKVFMYKDFEIQSSCTFGIYEAKKDESIEQIIENTDKSFYKEKLSKNL